MQQDAAAFSAVVGAAAGAAVKGASASVAVVQEEEASAVAQIEYTARNSKHTVSPSIPRCSRSRLQPPTPHKSDLYLCRELEGLGPDLGHTACS